MCQTPAWKICGPTWNCGFGLVIPCSLTNHADTENNLCVVVLRVVQCLEVALKPRGVNEGGEEAGEDGEEHA